MYGEHNLWDGAIVRSGTQRRYLKCSFIMISINVLTDVYGKLKFHKLTTEIGAFPIEKLSAVIRNPRVASVIRYASHQFKFAQAYFLICCRHFVIFFY